MVYVFICLRSCFFAPLRPLSYLRFRPGCYTKVVIVVVEVVIAEPGQTSVAGKCSLEQTGLLENTAATT